MDAKDAKDCINVCSVCNGCGNCPAQREPQPATGAGNDASNATSKWIRRRRAKALPARRGAKSVPKLKKGLADKLSALGRDSLRLPPLVNTSYDPSTQTSPAPNAEKAAPSGGDTTLPWAGSRESEEPRVAEEATTQLASRGRDGPMDTDCHGSTRPVISTLNSRPPAGTPQPQSPSPPPTETPQAQPSPKRVMAKKCGIPFYLEDGKLKRAPSRAWLDNYYYKRWLDRRAPGWRRR